MDILHLLPEPQLAFFPLFLAGAALLGTAVSAGTSVYGMIKSENESANQRTKQKEQEEKQKYDPNKGVSSGISLSGSSGGGSPGAYGSDQPHLNAEPPVGSLGRPMAIEQEPSLQKQTTDLNNFSF
jgi:hypothetical protein